MTDRDSNDFFDLNAQRDRIKKDKEEELLIRKYKAREKNGELKSIRISWITEIDNIISPKLIKYVEDLSFPSDFVIQHVNLDEILQLGSSVQSVEKVWPKNCLFDERRQDYKIANLMDYIEKGNRICPPYLKIHGSICRVIDGNHRIAIARYLRLIEIPIILRNSDAERFRTALPSS